MDGSYSVRVTRDGDHDVVHLPAGVASPLNPVVRKEGARLIIEPAVPMGSTSRLLAILATLEPIDEELGEIEDYPPEPVDF